MKNDEIPLFDHFFGHFLAHFWTIFRYQFLMILGKKGSKKWSKKWSKSGIFWKIPGSNIPGERGGVKNEHVLSRFFKTVKKRQFLRPKKITVFPFFSVQKWPFFVTFVQVATWGFWSKNGLFFAKNAFSMMPDPWHFLSLFSVFLIFDLFKNHVF